MKIASFDLEIAREISGDWQAERPLGISCAAIAKTEDGKNITYKMMYDEAQQMSISRAKRTVRTLRHYASLGFTIVTVNGLGFDFQILAEESGMWRECADLALNHHCDLMLLPVAHPRMGWRVGLQTFAEGAGVEGKKHTVTLSTGEILHDMSGSMAPRLWAQGEREAVLEYLKDDVRATLEVATAARNEGLLSWYSQKGRPYAITFPPGDDGHPCLPTVSEVLRWSPRPDVSWMSNPSTPESLAGWALERVQE